MNLLKTFENRDKYGNVSAYQIITVDFDKELDAIELISVEVWSAGSKIDITQMCFTELHDVYDKLLDSIDWRELYMTKRYEQLERITA